jgi:solute carrier family 25 carnitine/acylcarnitine transporter 20/29
MPNDFLYGAIGGCTGIILSHPFDTIKTRMQSGTSSTLMHAIKQKKLYAGLSAPLGGVFFEKSIVFGCYDIALKYGYSPFWSGIFGGGMSTLLVTPIDRIKIHLQNKQSTIPWTRLYKGFIPTFFRETPGFGIYFTAYSYLSRYNTEHHYGKHFVFGALSGAVAWVFIYPSDLIKTRLQASQNSTIPFIMKQIWTYDNTAHRVTKGVANFYKGFHYAMMRALPLHGGVFLGYELSKSWL